MNELQNYVDNLFQHQPLTTEVKDLKEEILSNMTAKRDDYIAQGINEVIATQKAKESLLSVDSLISGSQLTYTGHYYLECLQMALLNCIIFWIFTMPLLFTRHALLTHIGFGATVFLGIVYIIRRKTISDELTFISILKSKQRKKRTWIIWSLFFIIYTLTMAGITFSSNIWFNYPLNISGPYQFADIVSRFYAPLLTIVIPITISGFTKLLIKNEKRFDDE